jgi:hypothetical protein
MAVRAFVIMCVVFLSSACGQGARTLSIEQTPDPVRKAILSEAAGDPIVRITRGTYAGKRCYTVAVARSDRRSWYSVDELGRPCE